MSKLTYLWSSCLEQLNSTCSPRKRPAEKRKGSKFPPPPVGCFFFFILWNHVNYRFLLLFHIACKIDTLFFFLKYCLSLLQSNKNCHQTEENTKQIEGKIWNRLNCILHITMNGLVWSIWKYVTGFFVRFVKSSTFSLFYSIGGCYIFHQGYVPEKVSRLTFFHHHPGTVPKKQF